MKTTACPKSTSGVANRIVTGRNQQLNYLGEMTTVDRHKLHFGPYRTPQFKYGQKVECEARGEVTITKLSDGPIPWPVGWLPGGKSPVLYGSLVLAVKREAACAVCFWWGATPWLVQK